MSGLLEVNTKNPGEALTLFANVAGSSGEICILTPVGLKNAGLLIQGRLTFSELTTQLFTDEGTCLK